jgi:hypothetical protein
MLYLAARPAQRRNRVWLRLLFVGLLVDLDLDAGLVLLAALSVDIF